MKKKDALFFLSYFDTLLIFRIKSYERSKDYLKQEPILATRCFEALKNRQKWEGITDLRSNGWADRRTEGQTDGRTDPHRGASKNLQFKTKRGCVALTVWLQRLIKDTSYFQKSVVFQRFCKIAFWFSFTLFGTASKQIELQKPDWTTFEAHLIF